MTSILCTARHLTLSGATLRPDESRFAEEAPFPTWLWLLVAWVATTRLPRPFLYNPGLASTSPEASNLPFGNKSSLKTLSIDPSHATIGIHHVVYA